ncbi:MAG TPA: hypothetical protein VFB67_06705 [Candidatus Polarisedimenticolaceae bacterium]|nr:hypothetical protein [Candidatus Polarisedimenticolaceae bacterium]
MTRHRSSWILIVPILALAAAPFASADDDDRGQSRVQRGFRLAPVHLNLRGKNRDLVGLGSYIVNAQGGCNDCHTCPPYTPDHDPFTGGDGQPNAENYLAGGTSFGPFVSRNITPDDSGKPAGLTREEFIRLMRTGHDPDNPGELLQVMPWPIFGRMIDRDLKAVYEYLRSIPHAETGEGCTPPPEED